MGWGGWLALLFFKKTIAFLRVNGFAKAAMPSMASAPAMTLRRVGLDRVRLACGGSAYDRAFLNHPICSLEFRDFLVAFARYCEAQSRSDWIAALPLVSPCCRAVPTSLT